MNTRRVVIIPALVFAVSVSAAEKAGFVDGASAFGGPYVVTDYTPTSKAIIEAEVSWDGTSSGGALFGASGSGANVNSFVLWGVAGGQLNFFYSDWGGTAVQVELRKKYKVKLSPEGMWLDDVKVIAKAPKDFTCGCPLTIFAVNSTGGNKSYGTVYSLKAWEPDGDANGMDLKLDLRPCQCTDGLVQFYDSVSDTVLVNKNASFPIAPKIIVTATDGMGDAQGLVHAFDCVNKAGAGKTAANYLGAVIEIQPGVYRLSSTTPLSTAYHLQLKDCAGARVCGLGKGPEETVIVSGGEADGRGILQVYGGSWGNRMTISNLTFTGGYCTGASDNGGAVAGITGKDSFDCYSLIVSNNVAMNGGGICLGTATACRFVNNRALKGGGATYKTAVSDSEFVGNGCGVTTLYSGGGAVLEGSASHCVFTGNVDNETTGDMWTFGSAARDATLSDCVISNSVGLHSIVCACTLNRCRFVGCAKSFSSAKFPFGVLDNYNKDTALHNVVNCVFDDITTLDAGDRALHYGNLVNCTIRSFSGAVGSAPLDTTSTAVNTIISGCTPCDVNAAVAPSLRYCLWSSQTGDFGEMPEGCQRGGARFSDASCDIKASSPAFNAALENDEVLALVGETDCDGRPRTMFGHLDMGAMECQNESLPGLILLLK